MMSCWPWGLWVQLLLLILYGAHLTKASQALTRPLPYQSMPNNQHHCFDVAIYFSTTYTAPPYPLRLPFSCWGCSTPFVFFYSSLALQGCYLWMENGMLRTCVLASWGHTKADLCQALCLHHSSDRKSYPPPAPRSQAAAPAKLS